jgi:hypothetical protein
MGLRSTYAYWCPGGHEFVAPHAADKTKCHEHGVDARRIWRFAINAGQIRMDTAHWDPVVGEYVTNDRQKRDILKAQVERESNEMNMECKVELVDPRDKEALAELHRQPVDQWAAEREVTAKARRDADAKVGA